MSDRKSRSQERPSAPRSTKQTPTMRNVGWRERASSFFSGGGAGGQRKRQTRSERDHRRQQILIVALAAVGIVTVLILAGGALNEYFLKPRKVLASVNGTDITRRDYWKYREYSLINQATQYQQFAMMVQGDQQQQYLALAQQAQAQLDDVWGSTSTDSATLNRMVEDQVFVQGLESLGLSMSDQEIDDFVLQQFQPADSPIFTPTPSPTLIPERAEWATQTAAALAVTEATVPAATPQAMADSSPAPAESGAAASPEGSPAAGRSPVPVAGTPLGSPEPTATLSADQARETAEANLSDYDDQVLDLAHMSLSDYKRLVARPSLARQKVEGHFREQVGQSAEQVHAAHILVGTSELANRIYEELQSEPDRFAAIAQEQSIDEATAPNGGDLGWFPHGVMTAPFEEVAFSLAPGDISEPFETEFGWHIVRVIDRDDNRPLTDTQITNVTQSLQSQWLEEQHATMDISSSADPTPTPPAREFVPPAEAPRGSPVPQEGSDSAAPAASPQP